jgi:hypothetical protein
VEFEITTNAGVVFRFAGTRDELSELLSFLEEDGQRLTAAINGFQGVEEAPSTFRSANERGGQSASSPTDLQTQLDAVNANTDIERVAVMAHYALQSGQPGLTMELAKEWYTHLGIPKPGVWKSTFSNARARGYIHHTPEGWKPTTVGENFAVHGIRRQPGRRRATRQSD